MGWDGREAGGRGVGMWCGGCAVASAHPAVTYVRRVRVRRGRCHGTGDPWVGRYLGTCAYGEQLAPRLYCDSPIDILIKSQEYKVYKEPRYVLGNLQLVL